MVVLAAGRASRYGRLKQLEPVGPDGAALFVYSIHDAVAAGFTRAVLVVSPGSERQFEDHVQRYCGDVIPINVVAQMPATVAGASEEVAPRVKPWGTAHALLAAADGLGSAFAVINADDFYGLESFRHLHRHLAREPQTAALVGYELVTTLSAAGGVSRGLCDVDADGMLTGLSELRDVRQQANAIVGVDVNGRSIRLRGDETVSMNLWGLNSTVLAALREQVHEFFREHGSSPDAEFLLSSALDQQVRAQTVRLRVLRTDERWCGMTFVDDTPRVRQRIAELAARGFYPRHLQKGRS